MTSHHDVAARLRDLAPDIFDAMPITRKAMLEAADLLESQAKALSDAEDDVDRADKGMDVWMKRALAAEARLAEAMKVIEPFASRDMSDINDCVDNHGMRYQSQWFADATAAARHFLNAAKEKT